MWGAACTATNRQWRCEIPFGRNQLKGCMTKPPSVEGTDLTTKTIPPLLWSPDPRSSASLWGLVLPANSLKQLTRIGQFCQHKISQEKSPASLWTWQNWSQSTFDPWIPNHMPGFQKTFSTIRLRDLFSSTVHSVRGATIPWTLCTEGSWFSLQRRPV